MKARLLKLATLTALRSAVPQNLTLYREGRFEQLEADRTCYFEIDATLDACALGGLLPPLAGDLYEAENCETLYGAMSQVTPSQARDERLWAYLSHTTLLGYARQRWPIPEDDEKAVAHLRAHFFAIDNRQLERNNIGARLWWMAHLCSRVPNIDLQLALRSMLFRTDVRANLIERPTVSQSVKLFNALIQRLAASYLGKRTLLHRETFRRLMVEVNAVGGYRLLDCMDTEEIERILNEVIFGKLGLVEL